MRFIISLNLYLLPFFSPMNSPSGPLPWDCKSMNFSFRLNIQAISYIFLQSIDVWKKQQAWVPKKFKLDTNHSFQWILDNVCSLQPSWTSNITFAITSLSLCYSSCFLLFFWDSGKTHKDLILSRGLLIMHSCLTHENPPPIPPLRKFNSFFCDIFSPEINALCNGKFILLLPYPK